MPKDVTREEAALRGDIELTELREQIKTPEGLMSAAAELLLIREKSGALRELAANRVQQEYERRAGRHNLVLKARQMGVTTWIAAGFFLRTIAHPGTMTVLVAHDQSSAEEIFRIAHRFLANLPDDSMRAALKTSRANVRQLVFPRIDSEYRVETAADPHAGRGLTIHNLHCSEVARWPGDATGTLASLRAAVTPSGRVTLESTANGAGGCFYDEWQRAAETGYVQHFFPWWWEPSYVREDIALGKLSDDERELQELFGLTDAQLAFRRELAASFRGLAPQEFAEDPERCFLASGECFFDIERVEQRLLQCAPPAESHDNGRLQVWLPPAPDKEYIIGVDPAGGGTAGDYACAQVIERASGMQCAELHGHFPPRELAARVARLARRYNEALVAVERNNHGHGVLAHLVSAEQYSNLYAENGQAGWVTDVGSRPPMLESFSNLIYGHGALMQSERLLRECRSFVRQKNGSPAAAGGAHDDCVIAMAIALRVREMTSGHRPGQNGPVLASIPNRE